jgi:hypothetical protein
LIAAAAAAMLKAGKMKCFNAVAKLQVRLEKREHIILSRA